MKRPSHAPLDLGSNADPIGKADLTISSAQGVPLSPAQAEFNRLMKRLQNARSKHAREAERLDQALVTCSSELMPLIENLNRLNRDLVFSGKRVLKTIKLSVRRRHLFGDLLAGKATDLLTDPVGLSDEDVDLLKAIAEELRPEEEDFEPSVEDQLEFELLRTMMEQTARQAGLELDLSDLELGRDPAEFQRILKERFLDAAAKGPGSTAGGRKSGRKPTKAQIEKERKLQEQEEAKTRDFKSLFKQLAKAFHPDLEPDLVLKEHKEVWMKRLNSAYESRDLREMLQLEMEWLGEEATNLATAGEEKLKVYCAVLKEQIADLKRQTDFLPDQPVYHPLRRFMDPYSGAIAAPASIKRALNEEAKRHRQMLDTLQAGDVHSRKMIEQWADDHARRAPDPLDLF